VFAEPLPRNCSTSYNIIRMKNIGELNERASNTHGRIEERTQNFVENHEGKTQLRRNGRRGRNNIKWGSH
jgi:hypothetical protein